MTDGETFLFFIFLSCSDEIFSQRDIIFIIYYFIQNVKCDGEKDLVLRKKPPSRIPDTEAARTNADFFGKNRRKREVFILFESFPFFEC